MTGTRRRPCTAFSVFAGGASHPARTPDHALLPEPSQTPTCPHAGAVGFANPAAPMAAPPPKGVLGLISGQRPWLQGIPRQGRCRSRAPLLGGQILGYRHARTTSSLPCGHGNLLFLGKHSKEASERFAITPWHRWRQASHTSRDSPILVPWASHSLPQGQHGTAGSRAARRTPPPTATATSDGANAIPTAGNAWDGGEGSRVTFSTLCYSDGPQQPPGEAWSCPRQRGVRAVKNPRGLPSIVR